MGYDRLQFTQIKVLQSIVSIKQEDNLLFWQMIKLLMVAAVIYWSNSNTLGKYISFASTHKGHIWVEWDTPAINYRLEPSEGNWHIKHLKSPNSKNVYSVIIPHTWWHLGLARKQISISLLCLVIAVVVPFKQQSVTCLHQ